ncbi:unnamed protein product [Aureobasidium pullulans]|nr:unnamed protein product [Aureobasidium pullulans]
MNIYVSWLLTGLYYLIYPVYFLLSFVALCLKALLSPITSALLFLLQPVVLFGQLLAYCTFAPFRFLQRFEVIYPIPWLAAPHPLLLMLTIAKTIYIYLGVASITGLSCGLLLHFVYSFLYSNLHLAPEPVIRGPTSKQYRASRRRKDMYQSEAMLSPTLSMSSVLDTPGAGRYGLLAQTIHEEDSDF